MESDPGSDQVTPAVLPVTSMADLEMSSDIDMAGEMDLTTGVDFNSTLDVNHLLGIGAATAATEHMGADLDADAMFGSVSSTTGLLEDSMGMVDMSCSQSSGASSDVQGIVTMKMDTNSGDAAPPMSTRSSALSLQDSASELFPVDFPSGLSTDDSNTMEMLTTKAAVAGSEADQNNDRVTANEAGNLKESQEGVAVDTGEPNRDDGHIDAAKELDGEKVSSVEASETSSPLDLTEDQTSNAQVTGDHADKPTVDDKLAGIIDAEAVGDGIAKDVNPTELTVAQLTTETAESVPKVDLRKRKLASNVGQRRSTRQKPHITDVPTESSPFSVHEKDEPEVAKCLKDDDVDGATKDEPANKEEPAKDDNSSGDALAQTVPAQEPVEGTVGTVDVFEDSVVVSSPATRRNVARRGRPRKRGRQAAARGAKRQRTVLDGTGNENTTETSPSAPVLDKEQSVTDDGTGLIAPVFQLEEDHVENNSHVNTTSNVSDTKSDDNVAQTAVSTEKQEGGDTSAACPTLAAASVASSESSGTVDYTEETPDARQQEFTDEPLAVTTNTVSSLTNSEQPEDVAANTQATNETQSSTENTDAAVSSNDPVVEVKDGVATETLGKTEPEIQSEKEVCVETAVTEEKSQESDARTDAVSQEVKSTLCSGCSGDCTAPVKLSCSHVVCERCAPPDGDTAAPRVCPVCKSGTATDSSAERDPTPPAESDKPGNTLAETEMLEVEGDGGKGRTLLPTPMLPLIGPEQPPPSPFQGPVEEEFRGPGPPPPFRDPSLRPDGQHAFGPPPFRGPRPNCPAPPFRGPRPWQDGPPQPRGPPPPFRGPCPRQHGPRFDIPHSGPDGPPPFRGPRPTSQPPFNGPRACGPGPPFRGPCPRPDGPPCDEPFSESGGPPFDGPYPETDGPPFDGPYPETDGPPFDAPYPERDGPPFDAPYPERDGPPFDAPYPERDGPPFDAPYPETDGPPFDAPYPGPDGPPFDELYSETDGPPFDERYSESGGPPFDEPYSEMDGPPPFRGPPGSCGPPYRFRGPRPDGPPCDFPYPGPDGPPQFRGPPGPHGPPCQFRGPRPGGPPPSGPGGPRPNGPPPRPGGPRSNGPPPQFRGPCPGPPFRGPCPRGPRGPPPFRGPRPEGFEEQYYGPDGPYVETPLLSYPESEEQACVDTDGAQSQGLTGTAEDAAGMEPSEQAAPEGSSGSGEMSKSAEEEQRKTLLVTPNHRYDVPPPGTEPCDDWSQQQGSGSESGYKTRWSDQQAPPPPPTGWNPPQGGPPPPNPPYGPPPGGPGPNIPGPQALNVPPPNWYSQPYMQGGPQGWGYPPPPSQQWQQPYWGYGNNYDYYSYYQWYYNYYGQSQQYPTGQYPTGQYPTGQYPPGQSQQPYSAAGAWPPNEWSVAANSLAAVAAATTSGSSSNTIAVSGSKAAADSKLVVSTVSNRPMSSIPLPTLEPGASEAVTSWPPTPTSVTLGPPPPPATKPPVITTATRPALVVTRPARTLPPPQPVKSVTPVAVAEPLDQSAPPAMSPLPAPVISSVTHTTMSPKTGDSRVEKQKKQLYIFNLPQDTSLAEVKALVAKYGKVLDCAVADDQGRAGLLAVVTMETVAGATICCTGLRNYRFKGRQLEICRATTKKSDDTAQPNVTHEAESSSGVTSSSEAKLPDTGVSSSDGSAADSQKHASMWVGNLPPGTKAKDVLDLLNPHGKVINCKIGASKGKSDLFAMVVMETSSDITQCISKLHGSEFQGQKLQLKKLKQKSSSAKKAE